MNKVIDLQKDKVFLNSLPYNDAVDYAAKERTQCPPETAKTEKKYAPADYSAAYNAVLTLVLNGKLDALDLRIMAERDCSPMPTMSEVGKRVGLNAGTVCRRVQRILKLVEKEIMNHI